MRRAAVRTGTRSAASPGTASRHGDEAALLRRHRLHVTAQRLAVMAAVAARPHSTADELGVLVRAEIGAVSRKAVYDALATLTDHGLLRRVQPAGSPARYEDRVGDNHHHVICRTCGRMADVDCSLGRAPCLAPAEDSGFEVDEAEILYWGRCPACVAADSASMIDGGSGDDDDDGGHPAHRGPGRGSGATINHQTSSDRGAST
jgi:Fur family ferric uptake transcriptional regulator